MRYQHFRCTNPQCRHVVAGEAEVRTCPRCRAAVKKMRQESASDRDPEFAVRTAPRRLGGAPVLHSAMGLARTAFQRR